MLIMFELSEEDILHFNMTQLQISSSFLIIYSAVNVFVHAYSNYGLSYSVFDNL